MTDVHFPGNTAAARATLAHLQREKPEIVVITGDMTERAQALTLVAAFAREARGSLATVATLGNWEYMSHAWSRAEAVYRSAGVELLVNAHREIRVGGSALALVGLDDPVLGRPDLLGARAGLPSDRSEIWLVHAPGFASRPPEGSSVPAFILPAIPTAGRSGCPSYRRTRRKDPAASSPAGTRIPSRPCTSRAGSAPRPSRRGSVAPRSCPSSRCGEPEGTGNGSRFRAFPSRAAAGGSRPRTAPGNWPRTPWCRRPSVAPCCRISPARAPPAPRGGASPACSSV